MVLLFITLQAQVEKLLSVYRYHFPSTTIINANPTLRIYWSGVSILEAGLDCMEQLLKADHSWKYFFNSIGTALPGRPVQVKQYLKVNSPFDIFCLMVPRSLSYTKPRLEPRAF